MLDLGFARFDASGSLGFSTTDPLALAVHVQSPDIAKVLTTLRPKGPHYDVGGALQAEARIAGTIAKPRATVGFEADQRALHHARDSAPSSATSDTTGKTISVYDAEASFAKGTVLVAGSLPFSLRPFGREPGRAVVVHARPGRTRSRAVRAVRPGPQTKLGGTLNGRLAVEGTASAPRVAGTVTLADGTYVSGVDRDAVTKANAQLTFLGTERRAAGAAPRTSAAGRSTAAGNSICRSPARTPAGYAVALVAHGGAGRPAQYGRGTIDGTMQPAQRYRRTGALRRPHPEQRLDPDPHHLP